MLPQGWTSKESKSRGIPFYVNEYTKETTWDKPTEAAKKPMSDSVQALHLLKKHSGSRNPSSWRCKVIDQSKETSIEQIQKFRSQIIECSQNEGPDAVEKLFRKISQTESDCSSAKNGGDLGSFSRGQMQKSFEDASFALKVGELSDIVDSDSGIHIILRVK
mmetsp:Transcript_4047/g.4170  ORF Transcript_4047/g.4170 Transcript_4047/m.4170 type:complete len:162 (+) Transcript_4047:40-525(+)